MQVLTTSPVNHSEALHTSVVWKEELRSGKVEAAGEWKYFVGLRIILPITSLGGGGICFLNSLRNFLCLPSNRSYKLRLQLLATLFFVYILSMGMFKMN